MDYKNKIINYMKKNNGYITNKIVKELGVPTMYLTRLTNENLISRVERGIYILPDLFEDELFIYYLKYSRLIYCKNTPMVLNGLSNRSLKEIEANVPQSYNAHNIKKNKTYRVSDIVYNLGKTFIKTDLGNLVPTYNIERTICDMFVYNEIDNESIKFAIKEAKQKTINFETLYQYAKIMGIYEKIELLFEVL